MTGLFRINTIHPIPTFDNLTALNIVLDRMEELKLWLVYDMRWVNTSASQLPRTPQLTQLY